MIRVEHISSKLTDLRNKGGLPTLSTGSWQLDQHIRVVKGYPWFIGGQPYHGKTEVTMELLVKWSMLYGWKHYLYFGEGGEVQNIVADLCFKFVGKPYYANLPNSMGESDKTYAEQFMAKHFFFSDPDQNLTYEGFTKEVAEAERELCFKFDTTVIDPFNDLEYEVAKYGNNISYWLKDVLKQVRINSKTNNRIDILIVHVGDTPAILDKERNMYYNPPALPSQWEGGKIWNRRAFVQLNIWKDLDGKTQIIVNKAKPKEAKVYGAEFDAFWGWDWKRNRYYENAGGKQKFILDPETEDYDPIIKAPF